MPILILLFVASLLFSVLAFLSENKASAILARESKAGYASTKGAKQQWELIQKASKYWKRAWILLFSAWLFGILLT